MDFKNRAGKESENIICRTSKQHLRVVKAGNIRGSERNRKVLERMMMQKHIRRGLSMSLYVAFFFLMVIVNLEKKNLHTDEVYTYILANNTATKEFDVSIVSGEKYIPADEPWINVMTASKGSGQFNYENVWEKQALDVHPPLYYVLVHTISSFFPGVYSPWFAASINIAFALSSLFLVRKIVYFLTQSESSVFVCSCYFIASAGILSASSFYRMYVVVMFEVLLITFIYLKALRECNAKFYISVFITSVLGVLTHYYFLVWLFFLSLFFGIYLLLKRKWKDAGLFVAALGSAGLAAVAIFPSMIEQIFGSGYRGQQSIENFVEGSAASFLARIEECWNIVDNQLFSGLFLRAFTIGLLVTLILMVKNRKQMKKALIIEKAVPVILLAGPCAAYFLLVSRIAVYITDRYFHPIYPIIIILLICFLCESFRRLPLKKCAYIALCFLLVLMIVKEWRLNRPYLYKHSRELLNNAALHADSDCIYILNGEYEANLSFYETRNYKSVTFYYKDDLSDLKNADVDSDRGIVVTIADSCSLEEITEAVNRVFPELKRMELLGSYGHTTSYYFAKE